MDGKKIKLQIWDTAGIFAFQSTLTKQDRSGLEQ
jgi:GTPase SAR1 family protein